MSPEVLHYSIPALQESGAPVREPSERILSAKLRIQPGDVLISKLNPRNNLVVEVPVMLTEPAVASTEFIVLQPTDIHRRYLNYVLRSETTRQWLDSQVRSVTRSHQRVEPEAIRNLELDHPEHDEQRRIADFLDDQVARIDGVIAGRSTQIHDMAEQRDSLIRAEVVGTASGEAKRKSRLAWVAELPESWGEPRICQVARMGTGHTPSRSKEEYWVNCDVPWLTTGDVHRFRHDEIESIDDTTLHISELGLAHSAAVMHPAGTVALSRTASAGFSVIMGRAMATSQDYATWTPGPRLASRYLLWCLRTMRSDIMGRLAIGSTHKTIYFPDLTSIRVPLPSMEEQRYAVAEIAKIVDSYESLRAVLARSVELLTELKRSLITAAVSGEFVVSTADGSRVPVV